MKRIRRGGGRRYAPAAVMLIAVLAFMAAADSSANAGEECGPFGEPPAMVTGDASLRCWGGVPMAPWKDPDGATRHACVFDPTPDADGKRALLVYLHPSLFGVWTVWTTNLLNHSRAVAGRGDSGFIVIAPIGRKTEHRYPFPDYSGIGWDTWYRQFNAGDVTIAGKTYPENVDAAAIDHFIGAEIATGKIDPSRIYIAGWSNGAAMAVLYALNRPNITAVAIYSAPDPFGAFDDPCPQIPIRGPAADAKEIQVTNARLAIMHVHNSCDVAGMCSNAERLTRQMRRLGVAMRDVTINWLGDYAAGCDQKCGAQPDGDPDPLRNPLGWTVGLWNHNIWPWRRTSEMIEFLDKYPVNPAPLPPRKTETGSGGFR